MDLLSTFSTFFIFAVAALSALIFGMAIYTTRLMNQATAAFDTKIKAIEAEQAKLSKKIWS